MDDVKASMLHASDLFVCLFGAKRRINPCGSLASDGIKLNMMKKVKIYKISKRNDDDEFV